MQWVGKIIGGAIGLYSGGPIGLVLGVFLGNALDLARNGDSISRLSPNRRGLMQTVFFQATFRVMGKLAKSDGRVSESEIAVAQEVMQRMQLDEAQRQEAQRLFNEGKASHYDIAPILEELREAIGNRSSLVQIFLELQLSTAYADGDLSSNERRVIQMVCQALGVNKLQFELIHQRIRAQASYAQGAQNTHRPSLKQAYQVLGVDVEAGDAELKKAYRRLMSQHHPDKLVAKGLPEEMMNIAKEKTQEIQQAYELIKTSRKTQ